jgi:hypothetical protein
MKAVALIRRAVAFELALYRSQLRWVTRRPDVRPGSVAFSYLGAVSVLLWAFIVVSAVELVVVHVLLPWERVRLAADVLGVWGLVWMLGLAASYSVYPHVVGDSGLRVRLGHRTDLVVPWDAVASIGVRERSRDTSKSIQLDRSEQAVVLNVVMGSRTDVDVRLRSPIVVPLRGGEESVTDVRLYADDARGLVRLAREHLAATAQPRRSST